MAAIHIHFKELDLIIDVDFLITKDDIPTFLSIKDMVTDGLEFSIQYFHIRFKSKTQPRIMVNFFLIQNWVKADMLLCVIH